MDDKERKIIKPGLPGLPSFPPGMMKPGSPLPPPMRGAQSPFPSPQTLSMPMPGQGFSLPAAQAPAPVKDTAELDRMAADKEKLEKKISEMEKNLAIEKEKSLVAALKSQQDEALSSRVESSLKDIQDKMRRDRRDSQVEEERIALKGKIKELETRLAQERETWMQTLKSQLSERETQGKDVESHFVNRLQEMERRWLDEKAQWQKELLEREEAIRSLKSASERLREVQDEYRRLSIDKEASEKEISKLKDEVARAEREKASIESYIKSIPEKERALAEAHAEVSVVRMREERLKDELKSVQDKTQAEIKYATEKQRSELEKMQGEVGRLQAELGSIADRKNAEKNDELARQREQFAEQVQDKEKTLAEVVGEKMRAISELLKVKGFISRVQAVNAAMDKERGQLRLEKMQLAQTMASQLEDLKKLKAENETLTATMQGEIARARASRSEDIDKMHQEELARLSASHEEEMAKLEAARQAEAARNAAAQHDEVARLEANHRSEMVKLSAQAQTELDNKIFQLRAKYDAASEEGKMSVRRQLEDDYSRQIKEMRMAVVALESEKTSLSLENRKLLDRQKEYDERAARVEAERRRLEAVAGSLAAQKAEAERITREFSAEKAALVEKISALSARNNVIEVEITRTANAMKAESENRARFESDMMFFKQKVEQLEQNAREAADALEAERAGYATRDAAAREQLARAAAAKNELSAKLAEYEAIAGSLGGRLKWALQGAPKP